MTSKMASRFEHERLELLLKRLGGNDREIGARLNLDQSTVWRLRNRKIAKIDKYLDEISSALGDTHPVSVDDTLSELLRMAEGSPPLKELLLRLRDIMQEFAKPAAG